MINELVVRMARIEHRLAMTPGRTLHSRPEMQNVIRTLLSKPCRGLIRAAPHYRQSPLRAVIPMISGQLDALTEQLRVEGRLPAKAVRRVVNRALSELIREVCFELGLEPTRKKVAIGHPGHRCGVVFQIKVVPEPESPSK